MAIAELVNREQWQDYYFAAISGPHFDAPQG
jgi:hypothetical protein